MATKRGTRVSATSLKRRSVTKRMSAIDASDQTRGLEKRPHDGRRGLDDEDRRAGSLRRHAADRVDEAVQDGVVVCVSARARPRS